MDTSSPRVLLIDDDEDNHVLYRDMLMDAAMSTHSLAPTLDWEGTYEKALKRMARNEHDVYLLDYRLGARDGLDLLREATQKGCTGPIILLTGYGDRAVDINAMKSGAADFINKNQLTPLLLERAVRYAITHHRMANAKLQSERLATVGSMAARLAHEIRNPLGSILLNLDMALDDVEKVEKEGPTGKAVAEMVRAINSEVRRIQRTCEGYLNFARPPKLKRESVVVQQYLSEKLAPMQPLFESTRVTLQLDLDASLPPISVDKDQLWQSLLNLVRNAVDAMPDGGTLRISSAANGENILLRVADTGKGMNEAQRQKLFTPFFTTKFTGTGLGLPLTQQIIFEHGGRIECESAEGKGTAFTIILPIKMPA